jgi:Ca-activated chloride channel family protein
VCADVFLLAFSEAPASAPPLEEVTELVSVAVRLDKCRLLRGVKTKLHAVFCLSSGSLVSEKGAAASKPRVEMCLCLDKSGSMSDKLPLSQVALMRVLSSLSSGDTVSCIGYDNKVQVVFPRTVLSGADGQLEGLHALIKSIRSGGSTNMSQGMEAAAAQLQTVAGSTECVKRIFLFSDGLATAGLQSAASLGKLAADICAQGASMSTFGLGGDFNEDVMQQVAREGHGYFFYCRAASVIPGIVEEALSQTQRTVGTHASLALMGLNAAVVSKVYNHESNIAA